MPVYHLVRLHDDAYTYFQLKVNRPAVFTDLNVGSATPNVPTGWEAPAGSSRSFTVPDNWKAGRIWVGYQNVDT